MITTPNNLLDRVEKLLAGVPDGAPKACMRALNRAAASGRTELVRQVKREYTFRRLAASRYVDIRKATISNLMAGIWATGRPIKLMSSEGPMFVTKPRKPNVKGKPRQNVYQQNKVDGGGEIKHAFIAKMNSGHVGVYTRTKEKTSSGKVLLQEGFGPSVPQMLGNDKVVKNYEAYAATQLEKRLEHEIKYLLIGGK